MDEFTRVAERRPTVDAPTDAVRRRARARLDAIAVPGAPPRSGRGRRVLIAAGIAAAALAVGTVVLPNLSEEDPSILAVPPADAAVIQAVRQNGYTEIRFLDPDADPARIRREIAALGFDIRVTFVPADPFTVGHLVYSDGAAGLELEGGGSELQGGPIALRVPNGWTGASEMAIGRPAEPGESFETSIPVNAERPGGPMHCVNLRGLPADDAAKVVHDRGYEVEWRTMKSTDGGLSGTTDDEKPPAAYRITDVIWSGPNTIMLFAAEYPIAPSATVADLVGEGCEAGS